MNNINNDECGDLHKLGIPGFNRKTVKDFLKDRGANLTIPQNEMRKSVEVEVYKKPTNQQLSFIKEPTQIELKFEKNNKDSSS